MSEVDAIGVEKEYDVLNGPRIGGYRMRGSIQRIYTLDEGSSCATSGRRLEDDLIRVSLKSCALNPLLVSGSLHYRAYVYFVVQ
jgi:hypothetical protein